ncbi:MAG TPA: beta-ketoacyl-ACP reductase [Desulfobulbaceae bacterium]|nr:beta-ketoacyl-ACP reductase [Desulfobulbaceae bacterium]
MTDFSGQKAVVTGATRGIGRAIALALLEGGATVVGVYGGDTAAAERFSEDCARFGQRLLLHRCDVSDYQAVKDLFGVVEEQFDTIDILVNNAGIRRDGVLAMMPEEDWRRVLDVNLTGGYVMSKFAVQLMLKQRYGRIIFITSPMARLGFAGQANYAASKAGQIGMMKSLAKETAKRNITVNCVSPGFIDTDLLSDLPEAQAREYRNLVPLRRFGTPEEVAVAVLFLAGRSASYITGAVLEVTGGV